MKELEEMLKIAKESLEIQKKILDLTRATEKMFREIRVQVLDKLNDLPL